MWPAEGIAISGACFQAWTEGASDADLSARDACAFRGFVIERGEMSDLKMLDLAALHDAHGAKMVPFAGYNMPVQYALGVMGEHTHTRTQAGLFDVSHMGQVILRPKAGMEALALGFEALMPVDVLGLAEGRQRYGLLTNDAGGIRDDLMFANRGDDLLVVVNAACKDADIAHMTAHLSDVADVIPVTDRALLALQGPLAAAALGAVITLPDMRFMDVAEIDTDFGTLWLSRSGYTGEDGFEISVPNAHVQAFAEALLTQNTVALIGLGARDSLRLEAGLCLYGHDITTETSPIEAGLTWAIQKVRRTGGDRAGGFAGSDVILDHLANGAPRKRVGLLPQTRAPMREGVSLFSGDTQVGAVTSGGFGPTLGAPVAMGYVDAQHAALGTELTGDVRGKRLPVTVAALPFTPANFKR